MGAWGSNAFENDTAADWLAELPANDLAAHVEDALQAALPSPLALIQKLAGRQVEEYLDADVACIALAAAEVVAAWNGRPHPALSSAARAKMASPGPDALNALAELGRMAVQRIGENSELRDLWEESDEFDVWMAALEDLAGRLAG